MICWHQAFEELSRLNRFQSHASKASTGADASAMAEIASKSMVNLPDHKIYVHVSIWYAASSYSILLVHAGILERGKNTGRG